ncbi:RNA 2',3'-cyclic phosphodiesterase [Henriciella aquimarina]|uniref:RNA 2',3'-cyclic phosphodiesterase n=1 Tax=Henriciella aquimarina TaxID=545261 RepID=UPI000A024440|nr:RNA 2',3'-cyclic phosphodiesterase [Henriciella aquimarina]
MLTLFAALPVPDAVAERLLPLQTDLKGASWREREHFHITLAYFGEISEPAAETLDDEIGEIACPQFDLEIEGVGWFGRKEPHAAFATVKRTPDLEELSRQCRKIAGRLGLDKDARPFKPHITLAYCNNTPLEAAMAWSERWQVVRAGPWTADRFHLFESIPRPGKKSVYDPVAEYPLGL